MKRIAWNKGKKTGLVPSTAYKKGNVPWTKGRKRSEDVKLKISEAKKKNPTRYWLGKKRQQWARPKPSCEDCGKTLSAHKYFVCVKCSGKRRREKNYPRWIREERSGKQHLCSEYKSWMLAVKNRDGWRCKIDDKDCSGRLEAHHILNWVDYPKLRYKISNGITLCHFHHPRGRKKELELSPYLQKLLVLK